MKTSLALSVVLAVASGVVVHAPVKAAAGTKAAAPAPTAAQIVAKVVESDPWGLGGAQVAAKAIVTEKGGKRRALVFDAKSRRYAPPLGKSVITFQAPADVAGMKFLQIQNADADDERFLYTPELKRSRRIAGSNRSESFMGTDFSYADLDGRDLRQSSSVLKADETVGKFDCYRVAATPKNGDAVYARIELWVRKDNYVPLKWVMFDKRSQPVKTLVAREIQRHGGRWFITGSRMTDVTTGRSTELVLEKIDRREDIPLDDFSVRAIEKG
ncbi:MAG: outer membrane lipoprotein-sorting protein [Labilithrix sp.]|nr:outer membrane lipoprotein-sorting protein [Labilithrix sp.]